MLTAHIHAFLKLEIYTRTVNLVAYICEICHEVYCNFSFCLHLHFFISSFASFAIFSFLDHEAPLVLTHPRYKPLLTLFLATSLSFHSSTVFFLLFIFICLCSSCHHFASNPPPLFTSMSSGPPKSAHSTILCLTIP